MEWTDEAIVIGVRKHGETSAIAELMTSGHGRHLGLVQGGRSRTMRPVLQPGNSVRATWRARLEDHLGQYRLEGSKLRAATLMEQPHSIYIVQVLSSHLRLLPERDVQTALYRNLAIILDTMQEPEVAAELLIRFEIALLDELGFGLDLNKCAATGTAQDLKFVSPKSGCAVSAEAGAPWADRMLALPGFLSKRDSRSVEVASASALSEGFVLTGYFFDRHVYQPRGIEPPTERASLIRLIKRREKGEA